MPMEDDPPVPAPVTTTVLWETVTGERLEELLYGLFDEMGAVELTWRAGSSGGVTTSDGGRDLEAVFASPGPDGSTEHKRFWIESKGRKSTVPKAAVVEAVNNLTAHPEVDVFVMCTNGRYSNPTRDWVAKWQVSHPHPEIRLWDRDELSRLVRDYPVVAARSLPEALDDANRLELLVERFVQLGETPSSVDLKYFWERRELVASSERVLEAVAMFAYTEDHDDLVLRPWVTLLPEGEAIAQLAIGYASIDIPMWGLRELARPVHSAKTLETAAYLVIGCIDRLDAETAHAILTNPSSVLRDIGPIGEVAVWEGWIEHVIQPLWARVKDELRDTCASDCVRLSSEPSAFPAALIGEQYWRRFGVGDPPSGRYLHIETLDAPCLVGLDLNAQRHCPLNTGEFDVLDLEVVRSIREVVQRRRVDPDGLWSRHREEQSS